MSETSGFLDLAPHLAPLAYGDREAASRHEQQRRQKQEMRARVFGPFLALLAVAIPFLLIVWLQ